MSKGRDKVATVVATPRLGPDDSVKIQYYDARIIGSGSFGVVFSACLLPSRERVAIKTIIEDKSYRNRELQIIRSLSHPNIVELKYFYYTMDIEKNQTHLRLLLEYLPCTLFYLMNTRKSIPLLHIKLFTYQMFRSLAYLHSIGICHRDIKPANLLINYKTGVLKLCDFGSAKRLVKGETSVSYIVSRYYRAPELLFQSTEYTVMVDIWSAGCVLAEVILGLPLFTGDDHISQLVEIMKVLGTPSKEEIKHMNQSYAKFNYPHLDPTPWQEVFKGKADPEAIDLISRLLVYIPSARITPLQACAHQFFNKLREPGMKFPSTPLFNFTEQELKIQPDLNNILIPPHLKDNFHPSSDESKSTISAPSSTATEKTLVPLDKHQNCL